MASRFKRNSNLEILRILAMFFIIFHHFAVHGMGSVDFVVSNINTFYIYFFSIFGKIGVVLFILISGYFMINTKFTFRKFLILGGEVYFYSLFYLLLFLFVLTPVTPISLSQIGISLLPISHSAYWFITDYLILMFISPFLNKAIKLMSKDTFIKLLILLIVIWSVFPSFTPSFSFQEASYFAGYSFHYSPVIWFIVLYMIGSFIRLHVKLDKINFKRLIILCVGSLIVVYIVAAVIGYVSLLWGSEFLHSWVAFPNGDISGGRLYAAFALENSFFILIASVALFLIFLKRKEFSNKYINYIAGSTLGVYLIHDNIFVRPYLWLSMLEIPTYYNSEHLILTIIPLLFGLYIVCTGIDIIRRETIEKVWVWIVDNKLNNVLGWFNDILEKFVGFVGNYLK